MLARFLTKPPRIIRKRKARNHVPQEYEGTDRTLSTCPISIRVPSSRPPSDRTLSSRPPRIASRRIAPDSSANGAFRRSDPNLYCCPERTDPIPWCMANPLTHSSASWSSAIRIARIWRHVSLTVTWTDSPHLHDPIFKQIATPVHNG